MPKDNNRYQLLDDLDLQLPIAIDNQEDFKFKLFLRSREIKQVLGYLEKIMLKKKSERDVLINENREAIDSLVKSLIDDSNLTLEGMQMDQEIANLSMQLALDLRKSISLINALLYRVDGLAS